MHSVRNNNVEKVEDANNFDGVLFDKVSDDVLFDGLQDDIAQSKAIADQFFIDDASLPNITVDQLPVPTQIQERAQDRQQTFGSVGRFFHCFVRAWGDLRTWRKFNASRSASVLRFATSSILNLRSRSILHSALSAFYASHSASVLHFANSGILHLRSRSILHFALSECSTLRVRQAFSISRPRAFFICTRGAFSISRSTSVPRFAFGKSSTLRVRQELYVFRSTSILLSWGAFSSPWGAFSSPWGALFYPWRSFSSPWGAFFILWRAFSSTWGAFFIFWRAFSSLRLSGCILLRSRVSYFEFLHICFIANPLGGYWIVRKVSSFSLLGRRRFLSIARLPVNWPFMRFSSFFVLGRGMILCRSPASRGPYLVEVGYVERSPISVGLFRGFIISHTRPRMVHVDRQPVEGHNRSSSALSDRSPVGVGPLEGFIISHTRSGMVLADCLPVEGHTRSSSVVPDRSAIGVGLLEGFIISRTRLGMVLADRLPVGGHTRSSSALPDRSLVGVGPLEGFIISHARSGMVFAHRGPY
ncbi:hypothetical protein COLO4_06514 [Corchorus olitorius]|uniref:Uncharacterized protein n=1 Tax=Corchorus olitorius TaxID=93759 RepID=A0A1R3KMU3_9ROSI|nr:hypothetical protein COLO4_06514 [Corchorus olitorius]